MPEDRARSLAIIDANLETKPAIREGPEALETSFSVVAIGASAGGLEAYELFFQNLPSVIGMAFVLISHLDPTRPSMLSEILQRSTKMPVVEAGDQTELEPDHVYVIPPNTELAIFHGALQVSEPSKPHGHQLAIDDFFISLAEDCGDKAIGVLLSGTGSDGTLGLGHILAAGGTTIVQDPESARFPGMPQSAIAAGNAARVLAVEKIPAALLGLQARPNDNRLPAEFRSLFPESGLQKILMVLRASTGHDFKLYKSNTIRRGVERRMAQNGIDSIDVYERYLKESAPEIKLLFETLLISVTSFFRDPEAFEILKRDVLPGLITSKNPEAAFRVWVAGCATGEEAYSIAIVLRELFDDLATPRKIQIYATDLDDRAITFARAGRYSEKIRTDVSEERLRRFFTKVDQGYQANRDVRETIVFAVHSVIKDPPFTKLDLLTCRNLLIYLGPELQDKLVPLFHYALNPNGVLFLSPSESTGKQSALFAVLDRKWKLFAATKTSPSARAALISGLSWAPTDIKRNDGSMVPKDRDTNFAELTRRKLLNSYAPASVLVDQNGHILYVHGETGRYLRPAPGQATLDIVEMARDGLQPVLRIALQNAIDRAISTTVQGVLIDGSAVSHDFSLAVDPCPDSDGENCYFLVSFRDPELVVEPKPRRALKRGTSAASKPIEALERELDSAKAHLQIVLERHQMASEELKSSNEELQSLNEELQSSNEEMETSKEEMQSINEELVTVNSELHAKIEMLSSIQNDMKNFLDNVTTGAIFLDPSLTIRRYTREASKVYRLVPTDVGRKLMDIKSDLLEGDLTGPAQNVLDSLAPFEQEVRTASAFFLARIQPYRTLDNVIDGVVLTFTDITRRIEAEAAGREARILAEGIIETVRELFVVLDGDMHIVTASKLFYQHFQLTPMAVVGKSFFEIQGGRWNISALKEVLETVLPRDQSFDGLSVSYNSPAIGSGKLTLNARRILQPASRKQLILLAIEDARDPT